MPKIPDPINTHTTAAAIVKFHEKIADNNRRPHLGCSELGKECDRALWYSFHWASTPTFDGRMHRLFLRGHREEELFLEELQGLGVEVYDRDPETKKQHRFVGYKGHLAGSCDAIGRGLPEAPKTWAVIEFKTHGDKSFTDIKKNGVEKSKPEHWVQTHMYMGFAGLTRALYLAVNKNTDELYSEWIHFDEDLFAACKERAAKIIDAPEPSLGISNDPTWFKCKFCDHKDICHTDKIANKNCRTCVHATPVEESVWNCGLHNRPLRVEEQRLGCKSHLYIPSLINYAEPVDGGENWIKYQDKTTGVAFVNTGENHDFAEKLATFTSDELLVSRRSVVLDPMIKDLKNEFAGSKLISTTLNEPVDQDADIPF